MMIVLEVSQGKLPVPGREKLTSNYRSNITFKNLHCASHFFFIYFLWNYRWLTRRRQWHPTPVLLPGKSHGQRSLVGCSPWGHEESDTTEWLHFHFHGMEKEMATDSSVLAWRIPGTGEPGGLLSMGSHRAGHDWSDLAAAASPALDYLSSFLLNIST